jgi:hypothetical protein
MKICFRCNEEKELSEFYKHKQMGDGYLGKCKECTKKDVKAYRSVNVEKIRRYDRERAKLPHVKKTNIENSRRFRKQFPLAYKAHCAVNNAVRDGKLDKPTNCPLCNKTRQIEAHHNDYSKPLEIEWMCAACHRAFHRDLDNF